MNKTANALVAAAALACTASARAAEPAAEEDVEGAVGWSVIAVGVASPVQLPWGCARWDIYGLDFNLFYSDAPKMYGLHAAGLAGVVRDDLKGVQFTCLFNWGFHNVYGLRTTFGLNLCSESVYGAELGLVGLRDNLYGFDASLLGGAQHGLWGLQIGGLATVSEKELHGCAIAGIANLVREAHGLQLAVLFNMAEELSGAQIGIVNYVDYCKSGFQIGLVNIIMSNRLKFLPFVNGYF